MSTERLPPLPDSIYEELKLLEIEVHNYGYELATHEENPVNEPKPTTDLQNARRRGVWLAIRRALLAEREACAREAENAIRSRPLEDVS